MPGLQPFICPECGRESAFDPWLTSARCPYCGHGPPWRPEPDARQPTRLAADDHSFLDELISHWNGSHIADTSVAPPTRESAVAFLQQYLRAMGGGSHTSFSDQARRLSASHPNDDQALSFARAYTLLKRGDRATAAQCLRGLVSACPQFVDPLIWLTATTDDPEERIRYLGMALLQEPAHPLARDAMAIARERVTPTVARASRGAGPTVITATCPQCGGSLHYEPGAAKVSCPYCGHQLELPKVDLIQGQATLLSDLRLRRRHPGCAWADVQQATRCQSCGAALSLADHVSDRCVFCGTMTVLTDYRGRTFERPDGFLPFEVGQAQAAAAIRQAIRFSLHRLRASLTRAKLAMGEIEGVYLPFWVFDGFVDVHTRTFNVSNGSVFPTAPTESRDVLMLNDLLLPGMVVPSPSLLGRLLPFALHTLVPYEPRLLTDWRAALYQRDVEVVAKDAHAMMISRARARAGPPPEPASPGYVQPRRTFYVSSSTYQLVLLPVWIGRLAIGNKPSPVIVNGQTGKVALEYAWSRGSWEEDAEQCWWEGLGQKDVLGLVA